VGEGPEPLLVARLALRIGNIQQITARSLMFAMTTAALDIVHIDSRTRQMLLDSVQQVSRRGFLFTSGGCKRHLRPQIGRDVMGKLRGRTIHRAVMAIKTPIALSHRGVLGTGLLQPGGSGERRLRVTGRTTSLIQGAGKDLGVRGGKVARLEDR